MAFDLPFLEEVVLILIPTAIGAGTSKFIVNSWQSRKEKNDIKREILADYGNHVAKTFTLLGVFAERIIREIGNKPTKELLTECDVFTREYWELSYAANRFLRSLRLYYDDAELEGEYRTIIEKFGRIFSDCEQLIESIREDKDPIGGKKSIDLKLKEVEPNMKHFESMLIKKDLLIR